MQVMLTKTVCNSAGARKAKNAFKGKKKKRLTDSVNPRKKNTLKNPSATVSVF